MSESSLLHSVRLDAGTLPDVRLFRTNCGEAWAGRIIERTHARLTLAPFHHVELLPPGFSDTAGWRSVVVTPQMVGRRLAVFVGLETKTTRGRPTPEQAAFLNQVQAHGGIARIVRTVEDSHTLLTAPL